jgi:hypothetical protein
MKRKSKEFDVDFIGGGRALTKEDEEAISAFIKARKLKLARTKGRSVKSQPTRLKRTRSAAKIK